MMRRSLMLAGWTTAIRSMVRMMSSSSAVFVLIFVVILVILGIVLFDVRRCSHPRWRTRRWRRSRRSRRTSSSSLVSKSPATSSSKPSAKSSASPSYAPTGVVIVVYIMTTAILALMSALMSALMPGRSVIVASVTGRRQMMTGAATDAIRRTRAPLTPTSAFRRKGSGPGSRTGSMRGGRLMMMMSFRRF